MKMLDIRYDDQRVRLDLPGDVAVVGRSADCDIVIEHPSVSRRHLEIRPERDRVRIVDLGSTNGVWVEGRRVEEATVGTDVPFVVGGVIAVVRDVVSIDSGERPTPPADRVEPDRGDSTPGREIRIATDERTLDLPPGQASPDTPIADLDWAACDAIVQTGLREGRVRFGYRSGIVLLARDGVPAVRFLLGESPSPDELSDLLSLPDDGWHEHEFASGRRLSVRRTAGPGGRAVASFVFDGEGRSDAPPAFRALGDLLAAICADTAREAPEGPVVRATASAIDPTEPFIATTPLSRAPFELARRMAGDLMPVLVLGASGTGKELIARILHDEGPRARGPFVAINCSAIPAELLEAELFGIERGVATGVVERTGRFVQASGGTLFLDEIGDLPRSLQPKLLRALETREVLPVGAHHHEPFDVRVVSATNADLPTRVQHGDFRSDLFYRLAGLRIEIPRLADRREDILPLARRFAREASEKRGRAFVGFEPRFVHALLGYDWPGNVRELKHVIEGAIALSEGATLEYRTLPPEIREGADESIGEALLSARHDWRTAKAAFGRWYFRELMRETGDNMTEVARRAGLGRSTLYRLLDELGLR